MSSIFELKTSVEELYTSGMSKMNYEQHAPSRDVTDNNFPNGAIHFRWQVSGQKWWIPSRSYFRIRCKLTDKDGNQLNDIDDIAPNMSLASNLFQNAEFRINDKTVSRISDYMPQIDALETRLSKSRSWLESIGKSTNFWEDSFAVRKSDVTADGLITGDYDTNVGNDFIELGLPADTTYSYDATTGVYTFDSSSLDIPDLTGIIQDPDNLEISLKGVRAKILEVTKTTIKVSISSLTSATDLTINPSNGYDRLVLMHYGMVKRGRNMSEFEICWQPPLSIFKIAHALPSMKAEIVLNPQTSSAYQSYAIESQGAKTPNVDFKFEIVNMYFYCNTVNGSRVDDKTYLLDLKQTTCNSEQFNPSQTSFHQKNFDVSPSTSALTVAYQDTRCGSDSRMSSSKFRVSNSSYVPSEELKLNRFFINYAGQNLPAPDADPNFVAGTDYTTQRYVDTQMNSGAMFDTGGAETIEEFHDRGSYYHFNWPRDGTDRSTRVNVHQQFQTSTDTSNMRLLLFSHSKQVARIQVQDGNVIDVQVEDV